MSDTPITDKYCFKADGSCDIEVIDTIFVRQMERENAALRYLLQIEEERSMYWRKLVIKDKP